MRTRRSLALTVPALVGLLVPTSALAEQVTRATAATAVAAASGRLVLRPVETVVGERVTARASFTPVRRGRPVLLQRLTGSRWAVVGSGRENDRGTVRFRVGTARAGTFQYRAVAPRHQGAARVTTATRRLTVADVTPPPAPSWLTADPGEERASLGWSAVRVRDLADYRVSVRASRRGRWVVSTTTGSTAAEVTGLANETRYWFRVQAVDHSGNASAPVQYGAVVPTDMTPPPPPSGLVATAGNRSVTVSWAAVATEEVSGYRVQHATDASGPWTVAPGMPTSATTATLTDLVEGTVHWVTVTAVDVAGNESAPATPVPVTPAADPAQVEEVRLAR